MNYKTFWLPPNAEYVEYIVNDSLVNKFFEVNNPDRKEIVINVPDGCVNIWFLFKHNKCHARIVGSGIEGVRSMVSDTEKCFGVKFNAGVLPIKLMDEDKCIMNENYALNQYINVEELEHLMEKSESPEDRMQVFTDYSDRFGTVMADQITQMVIQYINEKNGNADIKVMADELGYCQQYLSRVFKKMVGMPMKQYARIVRTQYAFSQIKKEPTAEICDVLGYYDQPHFIKEFKKYSMMTPNEAYNTAYHFV
ncbi:helix-turn-helix transcriptional regulator [Kineothrix sp. MSJ-39]|uniref:helix-turn-helix domain-containing protein n=1 Tax=Kineothrix sp. MSJ-39 TaxID=2841533 RepID=UPI001C11C301|nr:helix-turn-helix transcriptional regulator [Kineothrix sp. MSJ-39]MBU5430129.1 helix-turn-helix transcriptional regulator [Kineothrix sp. MSJ-39]